MGTNIDHEGHQWDLSPTVPERILKHVRHELETDGYKPGTPHYEIQKTKRFKYWVKRWQTSRG